MAQVTIILTDDDDGSLNISVNFEPAFNNTEDAEHPASHIAAMIAVEAVTEELGA